MAFQEVTIAILRNLTGDIGAGAAAEVTYSDERLEELMIIAAHYVNQEIDFTNTYTIDILDQTISPDPTDDANKEDSFVNFAVLKASCLLAMSDSKVQAQTMGLWAQLGPARLETKDRLKGYKFAQESMCKLYDDLKNEFQFSGSGASVRAVLSPFISNDFQLRTGSNRDRSSF